jgi:hypothetical protein
VLVQDSPSPTTKLYSYHPFMDNLKYS